MAAVHPLELLVMVIAAEPKARRLRRSDCHAVMNALKIPLVTVYFAPGR